MNDALAPARKHPAALAGMVIAGIAMTALALVTVAYLLGYLPARGGSTPASMAIPGQQVVGTVQQGGVDLLPGETLVAPADAPAAPAPTTLPPAAPKPTTPQYARPAPIEPAKPAPAKRATPPTIAQPAPPPPSTSYAEILPQRAAPSRPTYNRPEAPAAPRDYCVNCGTIASIGTAANGEWEVRVRFEDGSTEALRYPDRPRLRIGDRVHLEDGRLIPD